MSWHAPRDRGAIAAATAVTAILHCLLLAVVWRPGPLPQGPDAAALQVVYIEAPVAAPGQAPGTRIRQQTGRDGGGSLARALPSLDRLPDPANAMQRSAPAPLAPRSLDNEAASATAAQAVADPEETARRQSDAGTGGRATPLVTTLPGADVRFRSGGAFDAPAVPDIAPASHLAVTFKPRITPENVVRDVARGLGFWPPGYTDSPCPVIRKTLDQVRSGEYVASSAEVDAILKAQARYCS